MTEIKLMIQDNLYKKTTIFSKLYNSNIVKPNIQRDEMEEHVSEIYEHIMTYYNLIGKKSVYSIPYLDGSLSISRASRTFPQYLIFKPAK